MVPRGLNHGGPGPGPGPEEVVRRMTLHGISLKDHITCNGFLHGHAISLAGQFTSLYRSHRNYGIEASTRPEPPLTPHHFSFSRRDSPLRVNACVLPVNVIYSKMRPRPFFPFPSSIRTGRISCTGLVFWPQVRPKSKPCIPRLRDW